jgi:PAS domain S-box-containing protein
MELTQRENDERFRLMADHAPVLIWISGSDRRCTWVNRPWLEFTGRSLEQEIGNGWVDGVHPEDRAACLEKYVAAFDARQPFSMEYRLRRHDGQWRWMLDNGVPLYGEPGDFAGYIGSCVDVTDRRQAEESLRSREQWVRAIMNTATDAIVTIDQKGVIQSLNPAAEKMFGYGNQELRGRKVNVLMPSPYCDEHDGYIGRYLATHEARVIGIGREAVGQRKDGSTFPVELAVSEVDHMHIFTGIIRDISDRKRLQEEVLRVAEQEQRSIGQELHDDVQQELAGLGLIAQHLAEALTHLPPAETGSMREAAMLDLRRLAARLATGIRDANQRVHSLARGLVPVDVDAQGLQSALQMLVRRTSDVGSIMCRLECEQPLEVSDAFVATHLYRITQEAVTNALKHSRASEIVIRFEKADGTIVLSVLDNGIGLPDKGNAPTGRGLRIMAYRAGVIGATLRVAPVEGGGTLVQCSLPRPPTAPHSRAVHPH